VRIVGTRTTTSGGSIIDLLDGASISQPVGRVDLASAYWDAHAFEYVGRLAERIAGPVRLVLWTAGGSRPSWEAARILGPDTGIELRFIDSPPESGIFHAKVAGAVGTDGTWIGGFVGSGNLTDAALRRNVELGVWIDDDPAALAELAEWFDELYEAATPASQIDWELALSVVPETSEAASRNRIFREAALAAPAPAGLIEPAS
jgi:phosphatidylserine/phosphatidylglycerophosphate/cardiolipin synthase-like enzyme